GASSWRMCGSGLRAATASAAWPRATGGAGALTRASLPAHPSASASPGAAHFHRVRVMLFPRWSVILFCNRPRTTDYGHRKYRPAAPGNFGEGLPILPKSPKIFGMAIGQTEGNGATPHRIRGVVFDMDGTLVHQAIDFDAIRRELGLPTGTPLLEALDQLPPPERAAAWTILDRHEQTAAAAAEVLPGVRESLAWLAARPVRRGVLTRNSRSAATAVLARCGLPMFDPVVSRDDAPYKPQPQGLWQICTAWGLPPGEVLMLGDYLY